MAPPATRSLQAKRCAALAVTKALVGAVGDPNQPANKLISLPQQAGLATVGPTGSTTGILRAARTQPGSSAVPLSGYYAERMSFILRVYLPDPAAAATGSPSPCPASPILASPATTPT